MNKYGVPISDYEFTKLGDTITISIYGVNILGKLVTIKLWTAETFCIYKNTFEATSNIYKQKIYLSPSLKEVIEKENKNVFSAHQEVYAEVIFIEDKVESSKIKIDYLLAPTFSCDTTRKPAIVGQGEKKKEETNCICKQYDLIWGNKVSCEFRKKVVEISIRQNFDPNHLMAVMAVETTRTFSPSKIELKEIKGKQKDGKYKKEYRGLTKDEILNLSENFSGAVGLIQFTPVAIDELNNYYNYKLSKRKLALMNNIEQLNYVEKYIEHWKKINKINGKLTLADLYLLIFSPSKMNGSDDNTTLYKEGTFYYNANKSVDIDGINGITKKELAKRAYDLFDEGHKHKAKSYGICSKIVSDSNKIQDTNLSKGVLVEMKEIADSHRPYLQEIDKNRTADTESGWAKMDCSEFVSRYLHKLGVTKNIIYMTTYDMMNQVRFRKVIENNNIDLVEGSGNKEFIPQKGDVFVWGYLKKGEWNGHTGIVYDYDETKDIVIILEAIGSGGAVGESKQVANGGHAVKGCTRTAKYNRLGGALYGHSGWAGYYRPKNYLKKL